MSDHSHERTVDWKTASPRWLLLAIVSASCTFGMFSASMAWSFYQLHEDDQERRYADWKGGEIAQHEQRITILERQQQSQDETLTRLDAQSKLARLTTQVENVNSKLDALTSKVERALREN